MDFLRKILFPLVPVYYFFTWLRNLFYDIGLITSTSYNFPLIKVGNLSVGGTGKTPMVEYLIRLLLQDHRTAVLSRGYKRKTKGLVIANSTTTIDTIGDEPYQMSQKFKNLIVAVDGNRRRGIEALMQLENAPEVIVMDDAYQHRKVASGLNILLTPYNDLYSNDILLPTGNLREPRKGAHRAQIIVVTKCPKTLTENAKQDIIRRLKPKSYQYVFFSSINYSESIIGRGSRKDLIALNSDAFSLVTGIANSKPLVDYLKEQNLNFEHLEFSDHHNFTNDEIAALNTKKQILTTEKDYGRLYGKITTEMYYIPIEIEISEANNFNGLITNYVSNLRLN